MAELQAPILDGPIPGQSLTSELGNRPWQQPPQYTTVEEAIEFYIKRLVDPNFVPELMNVIEMGVPLTTIANAMQVGGVMQGLHTIDVGILVMPVIIEMMAYMAEQEEIDYLTGTEKQKQDRPKSGTVEVALSKLRKEMKTVEDVTTEDELAVTEEQDVDTGTAKGLMARRA